MLAMCVPETEIKGFMNKLLKEDCFDGFDTRNLMIHSFARFEISGASEESVEESAAPKTLYSPWSKIRPFAFEIIKGSQKPKAVKVVFGLSEAPMEADFPDASALFLNIIFENNRILLTTGSSQKKFSLDKTLDKAWDVHIMQFFSDANIQVADYEGGNA